MCLFEEDIIAIYYQYVDMVYRICLMYLKKKDEAQDIVQNTFIKFLEHKNEFRDNEHIKAWLIVTSSNLCKNHLRHWWRKTIEFTEKEELLMVQKDKNEEEELLDAVFNLPNKYKIPIYLYYYEGYQTKEIANLLKINESTIRSQLAKGRDLLKSFLGGNYSER